MSLLNDALTYARRGWPVLLLYGMKNGVCTCQQGATCSHPGKHPIPKCSQKHATTSPELLDEWITSHAGLNPNLGVLTGLASGIIVLDVDPRNKGDETLEALQEEHGMLPITLVANTGGGGCHFYFKHPSDLIVHTNSTVFRGIDVKAVSKANNNAGYIIVPPSITAAPYAWRNAALPIAPPPEWLLDLLVFTEAKKDTEFEDVEEVVEGKRHDYLLSRAGKLRHDNWSSDAILHALMTENQAKCRPPLPDNEVKEIAHGILGYTSPTFRLNDVGNAKRLVFKYGAQLKHCWQQGTWYIWEGRYWSKDTLGQVHQFAKSTIEWMHEDALLKGGELGNTLRKHAGQSGRAERVRAMIEMARSEKEVSVRADELDTHPTLLNCPNCLLDLTTGKSIQHDPKLLITKITPTNYEPNAHSVLWEKFLKETTNDDEELQVFLQRITGYALSGLTSEEAIFFVYGPGGTGKSTYFETVKAILGDNYCKTSAFATFLKNKNSGGGGARSDIARLAGARLVTAVETEEGKQFAADLLKVSTGGDKITTRDLYQSEFEFMPQYKIWLAANSKPRVRDDDSGIWRRLLLIPFYHVVHSPDKRLKETLKTSRKDREGILAWAVRGFLDWQKSGWTIPTVVLKETDIYKNEMDSTNAWLESNCQKIPGQFVALRTLWDNYDEWMKRQSQAIRETRIDNMKAFANDLQKRGMLSELKEINSRPVKVFNGISLIY